MVIAMYRESKDVVADGSGSENKGCCMFGYLFPLLVIDWVTRKYVTMRWNVSTGLKNQRMGEILKR